MPGESTTRLVPVEREHLPAFTRWFNDPEVTRHLQWYLPMTLAAEEAWYEKLAGNKDEIVFSIESTSHGIIGNCAIRIDWKNRVGNLGIVIGE